MYPVLYSSEFIFIPAWHAFLAIASICAFWLGLYLNYRHKMGFSRQDLTKLFLISYIAGYFGARGLSIFLVQPELTTWSSRLGALFQIGPMTLYGGVVLAIGLGYLYVHVRKLSKADLFDISMPAVLLGIAIGRLGCFLNGDDFGKAIPFEPNDIVPWWAVQFPNLGDRVQQIWRYPVQLIEAGATTMLCMILLWNFRAIRSFRPSAVGFIALLGYSLIRFFDEYLRGDPRGWVIQGVLSPAQFISILVVLVSFIFIIYYYKPKDVTQ